MSVSNRFVCSLVMLSLHEREGDVLVIHPIVQFRAVFKFVFVMKILFSFTIWGGGPRCGLRWTIEIPRRSGSAGSTWWCAGVRRACGAPGSTVESVESVEYLEHCVVLWSTLE